MKSIVYDKLAAARIVTILIFLSLVMASGNLFPRSLSQKKIRPAVETWVRHVPKDARPNAIVESMEPYFANGMIVAYIAHLADSGFCICGADDRFLPVHVYSPGGRFDPENEFYNYCLEDMAQWISSMDKAQGGGHPAISEYATVFTARAAYWSELATGMVSRKDLGLYDGPNQLTLDLTSVWGQDSSYNYYCPTLPPDDPNAADTCVTGCVATAMAGVMRYWGWPVTGVGTGSAVYHYRWRSSWDSENLTYYPGIPSNARWVDRLEWIADGGGQLRMNGYWDGTLYNKATKLIPKYVLAGTSNGAFLSTNNGDNWEEASSGLTNTNIQTLAVGSVDNFFAGVYVDGIFRSTNYGGLWLERNEGLSYHLNIQDFAFNSDNDIFVGILGDGVYYSTDNGDTWVHAITGLTNLDVQTLAVNSNDDIFAGTDGGGVFISTDNGGSWNSTADNPTNLDIQTLAVNSNDDLFAGTDGDGVFRSEDNGVNWETVNTDLTNLDVTVLVINSANHIFAGTDGGGVFRSEDNGDNWVHLPTGLTIDYINDLAVNTKNHIFAATGIGVFRSTDNGNTWVRRNEGLTETNVKALAIPSCDQITQDYLAALDLLYNRLTPESEPLDADFSTTTYHWEIMEDSFTFPFGPEDEAAALISYHAGLSVGMDYGVNSSSAVPQAAKYVSNFRYDDDAENVALAAEDNYGPGFDAMIEEIQWLRPVQYIGGSHTWILFAYDRTYFPDSILWGSNSGNHKIDWWIPLRSDFHYFDDTLRFIRYIAPESVVRFVGSGSSGDGSPADPYMNIEEAVTAAPSGTTLIFKAGSVNTFSTSSLKISDKHLILRGKGATIRRESP